MDDALTNSNEFSVEHAINSALPSFFGQPLLKGTIIPIDETTLDLHHPTLCYTHPHSWRNLGG